MRSEGHDSGWDLVAADDEAAALFGAIVDMDPDQVYSKSELARRADVPLKTLYLGTTLQTLDTLGVLRRVEDGSEGEARFTPESGSEILRAARRFDHIVADRLPTAEAD